MTCSPHQDLSWLLLPTGTKRAEPGVSQPGICWTSGMSRPGSSASEVMRQSASVATRGSSAHRCPHGPRRDVGGAQARGLGGDQVVVAVVADVHDLLRAAGCGVDDVAE